MGRWMLIGVMLTSGTAGWGQMWEPLKGRTTQPLASAVSEQTARMLGLNALLQRLATLQAERGCGAAAGLEELTIRQQLMEEVQSATLDVDSVIAEIENEQGQLLNLRTTLQARRDGTVAKLNTAALITGSAAGALISATQFNTLSGQTNNIGDGFGVGAGVASTVFSVMATKKQNGPSVTVGEVPNMLAPLFDRATVLNAYYPPDVMQYLEAVPANEDAARGSRLEQLKAEWAGSGRLAGSASASQVAALTSSADPKVKVSINDLSNRIGMLVDVAGRVSLMKRDLATIMRSWMQKPGGCGVQQSQ